MTNLAQPAATEEPTKTLLHLLARVPVLPSLDVESVESMPAAHVAVWIARLSEALPKLNGVADVQGQRRLVRQAVRLASTEGEPSSWPAVTDAVLMQRARAAARYVRDAHPKLGAEMLALVDAAPRVVVDALQAYSKPPGPRRSGDDRPKRQDALAKLYRALQLGGHESQIRRRGALELP